MAKNTEQPIRCSFCGKRENQAARLIAGPGVYICSECVAACSDLLREELELMALRQALPNITAEDLETAPPGGESIRSFTQRIRRGFDELKVQNELYMLKLRNQQKEAMTICVCHGGVISGIMDYVWPGEYKNFFEWIPDPGHGYVLYVEDGSFTGYRRF